MLKPGTRVRVVAGSGLDSDRIGTVIPNNKIHTNGRGVPELPGHYKPVDWTHEVAIQYDDGSLGTMFKNRLIRLGWTEGDYRCACGTIFVADAKDQIPYTRVAEHVAKCKYAHLVHPRKPSV